jgi:hypothetical protein
MQNRVERAQALHDTRDWVQERRARTRQLIELGGFVQKAGLVELLHDDRAALLGAMMDLADQLRGASDADPAHLRARWRRAGMRAFEADKDANTAQPPAAPSSATRTRTPPLNQKA